MDHVLECIYEPVAQNCLVLKVDKTLPNIYLFSCTTSADAMEISLTSMGPNPLEHKIIEGLQEQILIFSKRNEGLANQVNCNRKKLLDIALK
jgi:hypothetical protein